MVDTVKTRVIFVVTMIIIQMVAGYGLGEGSFAEHWCG